MYSHENHVNFQIVVGIPFEENVDFDVIVGIPFFIRR